jgi:hypothetical protein
LARKWQSTIRVDGFLFLTSAAQEARTEPAIRATRDLNIRGRLDCEETWREPMNEKRIASTDQIS